MSPRVKVCEALLVVAAEADDPLKIAVTTYLGALCNEQAMLPVVAFKRVLARLERMAISLDGPDKIDRDVFEIATWVNTFCLYER
jgi:hypothetical protein